MICILFHVHLIRIGHVLRGSSFRTSYASDTSCRRPQQRQDRISPVSKHKQLVSFLLQRSQRTSTKRIRTRSFGTKENRPIHFLASFLALLRKRCARGDDLPSHLVRLRKQRTTRTRVSVRAQPNYDPVGRRFSLSDSLSISTPPLSSKIPSGSCFSHEDGELILPGGMGSCFSFEGGRVR